MEGKSASNQAMVRCDDNFIDNEMVVLGEVISVSRHQAGTHSKEVIDPHVHKYLACFIAVKEENRLH